MPRAKVDPVTAVLDYFETAELPAAELALRLAKRAVDKRNPVPEKKISKASKSKKKSKEEDRALPFDQPAGKLD